MKYTEVEGIDTSTYAGKAAEAVQLKARGIFGGDLLTFTLIDFVDIMLLNNKFASIGIHITDDNREESYIKIIEMGDPQLIDDLEKFINLKDSIRKVNDMRDEYYDIVKQLQEVDGSDSEKVNSIVEDYLRR